MNSRARMATAAAATALVATTLTGCAKGPLDIRCEEYLTLPQSQQVDLATQWSVEDGSAQEMAEMLAESTASDIASYCQDNPDTKLSELERTFG